MIMPTLHANVQPATDSDEPLPADIAEYIADVLAELREMAQASGHAPLTVLLEVARREALLPEA